jgi:hypothetical protein
VSKLIHFPSKLIHFPSKLIHFPSKLIHFLPERGDLRLETVDSTRQSVQPPIHLGAEFDVLSLLELEVAIHSGESRRNRLRQVRDRRSGLVVHVWKASAA